MKHIEQYYRNLCEQLQQQLLVLEAKVADKKKKKGKKLDPVGKEDADIDNDGEENTKSDKYLMNRRKARGKAIKGEIKEGRQMQSADFIYGGFPRILNEEHNKSSADLLQAFMDNTGVGSMGGPIDPKIHAQISEYLSPLLRKGSLDHAGSEHVEGLHAAYRLLKGQGPFAAHIEDVLERLGDQAHARGIQSDQNKMYFRDNR